MDWCVHEVEQKLHIVYSMAWPLAATTAPTWPSVGPGPGAPITLPVVCYGEFELYARFAGGAGTLGVLSMGSQQEVNWALLGMGINESNLDDVPWFSLTHDGRGIPKPPAPVNRPR